MTIDIRLPTVGPPVCLQCEGTANIVTSLYVCVSVYINACKPSFHWLHMLRFPRPHATLSLCFYSVAPNAFGSLSPLSLSFHRIRY